MKQCRIIQEIRGQAAVDGAGVHLVRVLGNQDTKAFDPFLMLDSFDSTDPADYVAGFPTHPHRGIETITYLIAGEIEHEDSLGNQGVIRSGEAQWMTAGSGILHQEMPKASPRMLGFQAWLNLPAAEKMTAPRYCSIESGDIPCQRVEGAEIRVLSGRFGDAVGITPQHVQASIYDISLDRGAALDIPVGAGETAFVFLILGDAIMEERQIPCKTAVLFDQGDQITVAAPQQEDCRLIVFMGKPLREPIAWGGPIVMNTNEELRAAFQELRDGTFIRHE